MSDAMEQLVEVTNDDIENGIVGHICRCPVAHALARAFNLPHNNIYVNCPTINLVFEKACIRQQVLLPYDVIENINHYDTTGVMEPFSFTIAVEM